MFYSGIRQKFRRAISANNFNERNADSLNASYVDSMIWHSLLKDLYRRL